MEKWKNKNLIVENFDVLTPEEQKTKLIITLINLSENNPEPELNPTRWDPDEVEEVDPQEDELEFQSDSDSDSEW